jgi:hypothetical protein
MWLKACSNTIIQRCRVRTSQSSAIKLGADSDVDPVTGNPTLANGICSNTVIEDCFITGDIQREKSYTLYLSKNQFGIVDNGDKNARLTLSGDGLCISETIIGNLWDPLDLPNKTGFLIDGGSGALSSNLMVTGNLLAGANGLVRVNKGSAIVTANRGTANAGVNTNQFVRIENTADNVYVFGNNDEDYCAVNTIGNLKAKMVSDQRSSKFLPVLISSKRSADFTFTSNLWTTIQATNHKFTGCYVRFTYSTTIEHAESGVNRNYATRVRVNNIVLEEFTRRITLKETGYGILSASCIVYVPESEQSVNVELQAQQVTGSVYGTVKGDSLAQSTFTVEILNT